MYNEQSLKPPVIGDYVILFIPILLVSFGLVMIYSTTGVVSGERLGDSWYYVRRQGFAALLGLSMLFLVSRINVLFLRRISFFFWLGSLFLLVLTLVPGLGSRAGGASRWLILGPLRFEPVELVKISIVLYLASYFSRHEQKLNTWVGGVAIPLAFAGACGSILLLQPDFGSTAVIFAVTLIMMFAAGVSYRYFLIAGLGSAMAAGVAILISPYRMSRVLSFMSPGQDASGKGYQLMQSLIAVGSGQVSGVGLGASQQKLYYLPAAHTDFIFSVIAEELGLIGCVLVIALFLVLLWRGIYWAMKLERSSYGHVLAVGLVSLIVVPAFLNMGVVLGLLPTKGLVLPLVGYGGSSLVGSLLALGFLMGLINQAPKVLRNGI